MADPSNNENEEVAPAAAPAELNFFYENEGNNGANLTEEELAQIAREVNENNRLFEEQRRLVNQAAKEREIAEDKATRILKGLPGRASWISRAKGRVNTRRKAEARNAAIRNKARTARQQFKQNINNIANMQYGTNAEFQQRMADAGFLEANQYNSAMNAIQMNQSAKSSFKNEAVTQLRRTLQNTALAENARLYAEAKGGLESYSYKNAKYRPLVLKIAALDDMMVNEKAKLALANTNEKAAAAATRLYNINLLKDELDETRHMSKVSTAEQNARYKALVQGFNFNSMPTSLYRRVISNNANLSRKNKAATKIQALARGATGRKGAKAKRTIRNTLARMKAEREAAAAAVATAVLTPAQMREARLAAMAKRGL
jgi:hypothetical protein